MILVFLGAAGSGKDTQAEILADKFGFKVISSGQIFRDAMQSGSAEGKETEAYVNSGKLVPDELVYRMLGKYLEVNKADNMIFTGTVRTKPQIELLDATLAKLGLKLDHAIYFKLDDAEAVKRISGRRYGPSGKMYHLDFKPPKVADIDDETGEPLVQRDDDKQEAITKRLAEFHINNTGLVAEYQRRGQLIEIDASQSIEHIAETVKRRLDL